MSKNVLIIGGCSIGKTALIESIKSNGISIVENYNPFDSEPIIISNPYKDCEIPLNKNKFYDKPKSKFHK